MSDTFGIHWIATTYGTWLHGDPHGSWQDGKLHGPDSFLESSMRDHMNHVAVALSDADRVMVAASFGATCHEQGHQIYAAAIQPTHVHLVFAPVKEDIKNAIARLKRRSAAKVFELWRTLCRDVPRSMWTKGQFARFLYSEEHLRNAIEYVRQHNIDAGVNEDPYEWIEPWDGW